MSLAASICGLVWEIGGLDLPPVLALGASCHEHHVIVWRTRRQTMGEWRWGLELSAACIEMPMPASVGWRYMKMPEDACGTFLWGPRLDCIVAVLIGIIILLVLVMRTRGGDGGG